jgi:uncharacterized membrane protein YedE/YeeE
VKRHSAAAALSGAIFGAGLLLSGMVDPARVLGFLTLGHGWDPSLAFVMGGALAVTLPGFAWLRRRERPLLAAAFTNSPNRQVDGGLVTGALIFGLGWGLGGYCPGPGIVGTVLGSPSALVFLVFMLLGGWLASETTL